MEIANQGESSDQATDAHAQGRLQRFVRWSREVDLERKLVIALLAAAVTSGVATFAAMTERLPAAVDAWVILLLLNLDLVLLLGLGALIARRLVILRIANKRGAAGARLHTRVVALFSLVAVTPTIIVATFAVLFFDYGLQGWFSQRVSTAVRSSLAVAEAYLEEHRRTITGDVLAMAQDVNRQGPLLLYNAQRFNQFISNQSALRSLTEAVVFDQSGRVLARAGFSLLLDFDPQIPDWAMRRARSGEVVILTAGTEDRVRALVKLDAFSNAYLFVGRLVDPRVLAHIDSTRGAVKLYEELEGKRSGLQVTFALIFVVVALLLLLVAVWVGLAFANYLTRPISNLIEATERVRAGDLSARVKLTEGEEEIGPLLHAFNRMTGELENQRRELVKANRQLDARMRFIEAVLSGVPAGVIGLDRDGRIELPNRLAGELLTRDVEAMQGERLSDIIPEMKDIQVAARERPGRVVECELTVARAEGGPRTLLARVVAEKHDRGIMGFVVTFDDITELLAAQRKAAWADIARRIAHEIKNPLTPIQLSAERIKRKYLKQITDDPETFEICTDTIIRQVGDIGRMVDEFSSFARMPTPVMSDENLCDLIKQAVFLQRSAHPEIEFIGKLPDGPVIAACDSQQIGRALTNLLQNAVDAIEGRDAINGAQPPAGRIEVTLVDEVGQRSISVSDNGRGLPRAERYRLTEPYITTRERGTGLGLAIVKKIMEDHGGDLLLEDREGGGARVSLIFVAEDTRSRRSNKQEEDSKPKVSAHGT